jgi:CRP-like cAMP-binding protein
VTGPVRHELRELIELNLARIDARLDQRFADLDAKLDRRLGKLKADLITWMFVLWATTTFTFLAAVIAVMKL